MAELKPIYTETLNEKICFELDQTIPDTEILAVVAAVQSYIRNAQEKNNGWNSLRPNYKRILNLEMSLIVPDWNPVNTKVLETLLPSVTLHLSRAVLAKERFDYYRYIARGKAVAAAVASNRHAVQGYGILIGSDGTSLPNVQGIKYREASEVDFLVLDDDLQLDVEENVPERTIVRTVKEPLEFYSMLGLIVASKVVIGRLSLATYFANCFGKKVIELYPPGLKINWLSKWDNKLYRMIVADNLSDDSVKASFKVCLEKLWKTTLSPLVAKPVQEKEIQTVR